MTHSIMTQRNPVKMILSTEDIIVRLSTNNIYQNNTQHKHWESFCLVSLCWVPYFLTVIAQYQYAERLYAEVLLYWMLLFWISYKAFETDNTSSSLYSLHLAMLGATQVLDFDVSWWLTQCILVKYDSVNGLAYERSELIYSKNVYDIAFRLIQYKQKFIPGYDKLESWSRWVTSTLA